MPMEPSTQENSKITNATAWEQSSISVALHMLASLLLIANVAVGS